LNQTRPPPWTEPGDGVGRHRKVSIVISHSGTGDLSTSIASRSFEHAPVARIGSAPGDEFENPTFAAGAVLWRRTGDGRDPASPETADPAAIEIAVIHRPRYDDWSLPKGKVDKGENLPQTAAREIREETGYSPALGWLLGYVHYPVGKSTKVVYYWTAEVTDRSAAVPEDTDEVEELRWLSPAAARDIVSYAADREVIDAALDALGRGAVRRVLYVRHAKAADRRGWQGDDQLRPLTRKGRRQAESLVPALAAYRPGSVAAALPERCVDTVSPLADALGLEVVTDPNLGDAVLEFSPRTAIESLAKACSAKVSVVASQGDAIPAVVQGLAADAGFEIDDFRAKKASVWVLHVAENEQLLGADYLASPLPVK